jgi:hypothetical protein
MAFSFYDTAEDTAEVLKRMQIYVDLAIEHGDQVWQSKPGELTITIRLPKKEKSDG